MLKTVEPEEPKSQLPARTRLFANESPTYRVSTRRQRRRRLAGHLSRHRGCHRSSTDDRSRASVGQGEGDYGRALRGRPAGAVGGRSSALDRRKSAAHEEPAAVAWRSQSRRTRTTAKPVESTADAASWPLNQWLPQFPPASICLTMPALVVLAGLAQLVEQRFCKPWVAGSTPAAGTISNLRPPAAIQ